MKTDSAAGDTAEIVYEVVRSGRKTVGITVFQDGRVLVRAPQRAPAVAIARVVREKGGWIRRKQEHLASLPPPLPAARYVDGEEHLYLGQAYPLLVREHQEEGVTLQHDRLLLHVRDRGDTARKKRLLEQWYRQRAKVLFAERLTAVYPRAERLGIPYPPLKIRLMKTRWGSCSSRGNINLNLRLIQTPAECIDYVIVHELVHLREPNHSRAYYELLGELMPDWRARLQALQEVPVR